MFAPAATTGSVTEGPAAATPVETVVTNSTKGPPIGNTQGARPLEPPTQAPMKEKLAPVENDVAPADESVGMSVTTRDGDASACIGFSPYKLTGIVSALVV